MNRFLFTLLLLLTYNMGHAQSNKSYTITKTDTPPIIDGVLDDLVWKNDNYINNFTQFRPTMGVLETNDNKTVVQLAYDDEAIYVAAYLYDDPSKILRQVTSRDNFGQSDFFAIALNPNNDGQNDVQFFVFSSGTQADAVVSPTNGEDFSWNAVWKSSIKMVKDGWIAELKIPYSALRFSNNGPQTWGMNFHRHFRRTQSQYSWSAIDRTQGNIGLYHGELKGLKDIKPPTRLSFYPFISTSETRFKGSSDSNLSAGLDVKYGLSENFTLDATLIPDFSLAAFDDVVLNLSPFEQTYSEQRQFFTEGVDLFNKGRLFYSRRIGNTPINYSEAYNNLSENETVIDNPESVTMLNAIKVSGRTKNGLGIGVFNAITEKTKATIKNTSTGETRTVVTEPFSNYNVLVIDQQFNKNSSISFVNTNVTRNGHFRDANVTAALFDLTNKSNTYGIRGHAKTSAINTDDDLELGFSSGISFSKISGAYQFRISHRLADDNYDINDFGISRRNNYNNFSLDATYQIFEPTKTLNNFRLRAWANYRQLYNPNTYTENNFGVNVYAKTKTLHDFGGNINFNIGTQYDYFETRTEGRYVTYKDNVEANVWISTNYNKKLAANANIGSETNFDNNRDTFVYWFGITPRYRPNTKMLFEYSFEFDKNMNDFGYVTTLDNSDIIFGERTQKTIENSIAANYNISTKQSLSLTFRNYWTTVNYENTLHTLADNGSLHTNNGYTLEDINDPNLNFNIWNIDFRYTWEFAPGSLLTAVYRNELYNNSSEAEMSYVNSLNTLFKQSLSQTVSLKLVYYLDYNSLVKS